MCIRDSANPLWICQPKRVTNSYLTWEQAYCRGPTEVSRRRTIKTIQAATRCHSSINLFYTPTANLRPIFQPNDNSANHKPIYCQSMTNQMPIFGEFPQFNANLQPIQSITNPPIECQFITNPLPILQRSANPSPIQKHNAHIGPIHQSITKSTIRSQSQTNLLNNPSPIHHSNANPPRHYQPINPMPTLRRTANPGPIHQSNANPWLRN